MPDFDATLVGLQPGQAAFGRYTLIRQLGRGGMGVVWLARDEKLEREVALKFLTEALAHDPVAVNDLKRETRRALELTHSHIVRIYDFIDDGHTAAVSMEYVDGASLTQRRLAQPAQVFSSGELGPWVEQLCEALHYAHTKAKIVHRDLKPANLMVDARGDLKVADFGISATLSETATRASQQVGSSGTPVYMSPQQMMGEKPAVSDDLYALGATLYELLTGKPPFYSGNIFMQVQQKVPPSLAQRREDLGLTGLEPIPAAWEETIAACLAKEPEQRPASAREVRERLAGNGEATVLVGGGDATVRVMEPAPDDATVSLNAPVEEDDATVRVTPMEETAGDATIAVVPDRAAAPEPLAPSVPPARSRRSLWPWVAALLVLVAALGATLGWYYGIEMPAQRRATPPFDPDAYLRDWDRRENARLESIERLAREGNATEAMKLFTDKELLALANREPAPAGGRAAAALRDLDARARGGDDPSNGSGGGDRLSTSATAGKPITIPGLNLELLPIPAGSFAMGSTNGEADEKPVTQVQLTQPFWLGKTEVTQGQWERVMGSNPSAFKKAGANAPVEQVFYEDALAFCQKVTASERAAGRLPEGYAYTLPTEAQWEYACRAGTTGDYAGNLALLGWYSDNSGSTTHAVGQKQANAWGLYDLHGNVCEWCRDWFGNYPGGTVTDPTGAASGTDRVLRGGCWFLTARNCRSASRFRFEPGLRYRDLGFRLALAP